MVSALKIAAGVFALVLLGLVSIHGLNAPEAIEKKIVAAVETARGETTADWAEITVDGRNVRIAGVAPSEEAAEAFLESLRTTSQYENILFGSGAIFTANDLRSAGPSRVAREDTPLHDVPQPEQSIWRADHRNGMVTLTGGAPSETARRLLALTIEQRFPEAALRDATTLGEGADEGAWLAAAGAGLTALAALETGELIADGDRFVLKGLAPDDYNAERAKTLMRTLPVPFTGAAEIRTKPKPAAPKLVAVAPSPTSERSPEDRARSCQSQIDGKLAGREITFASGEAAMEPKSFELLNTLSDIVTACSDFRLIISGHTDASGPADDNLELSAERAEAVKAYLIARGVEEKLLIPVGYGETRPVASNDTSDGRARNRRIEFTIALAERKT